jgi:hypothetical protein
LLTELDEKLESVLNLIEPDGDSFAERAEMYCMKRPEIIKMIEDLCRSHWALALHCDHQATKSDFDSSPPRLLTRHHSYDSSSSSFSDSVESASESKSSEDLMKNLREEIDRLKEENKIQKKMLVEKDEEKREAIRQLSLCVDSIKQEKLILKKMYPSKMQQIKKNSLFSRVFWGKWFYG